MHERDLYSSKQIALPFPQFVVFYNGTKEEQQKRMCILINKMVEAGLSQRLEKLSDPVFLKEMFEYFNI